MTSRHGPQERREWAKRGGRKPNRSLLEIRAAKAAETRARTEARKQARKERHEEEANHPNVIRFAKKTSTSSALAPVGPKNSTETRTLRTDHPAGASGDETR